ncbi:porin [Solimonas aquatica]|uniref:porin n=1 Tax=Solimonas aquatica TaxID=489703 RepID=UPI001FE01A68
MSQSAQALDLEAGDWKFSVNGNVNVHYIYSACDNSTATVTGGLACNTSGDQQDNSSSISNGLLPAALTFGISTLQKGYDIAAHFGLYPGISTNDGGSPNLESGGSNTALGTTGMDVRQVYMTFGNASMGSFTLGRNFGLFGFDAIINDMTLPGVGGSGAASSGAPANTTLGGIGYGYIYTDTLAQIDYTTPDFGGLKLTVGVFDPLNPVGATAPTRKSAPGFHGKAAFTTGPIYLSATFITQKQEGVTDASDFTSTGFDVGGKLTFGPGEVMAYYYSGSGMGTTALFNIASDGLGHERDSDGFIAQATYKLGDTKLGVNYGESKLDYANNADRLANPTLVEKNSKYTAGVYHSLTANLTLLAEYSGVKSEAHNGGEIKANNFNVGAFLSF